MAGPFDMFDPSQLSTVQGANGPLAVPSSLASRFQQPLAIPPIAPPVQPQPAPLAVGGVPLPADMAAKFAPALGPDAPPIAPVRTPAPAPAAKPPAPQSEFAAAQAVTDRGLAERQQAAIDRGGSEAASAEAQADAIAEGNRQADLARAAAAKQAEQDKADQQRMSADLQGAQKAYADHKVDQARFWHDSSTGSKVLMGIGLALSAAGSVLKHEGAKNPALDMIMGAVKQDVALQMADRDKLGAIVGQKSSSLDRMMAITRDNQATAQAAIAASLERVKGQVSEIAARAQSPAAKANALDLHGQLTIEEGKSQAAAEETMHQRKVQDQQLALQRQQVGIAGGQLALAQAEQKEKIRQFDLGRADTWLKESMDALQKSNATAASLTKAGMSPEAAKAAQEMGIKQREQLIFAPQTIVKDPKTGEVKRVANLLTTSDGQPLQIPKEEAAKVRSKMSAAVKFSGLVDELVTLRKENGVELSSWNSTDRQKMDQIMSDLVATKKDVLDLGAMSEADYDLALKSIGTSNPGGMRDPTDVLMAGRRHLWDGVNADLQTYGYDGGRVEAAPPSAVETFAERETASAAERDRSPTRGFENTLLNVKEGFTPGNAPARSTATPKAINSVVKLALTARQGDEESIMAIRRLADSDDPAIRGLARSQIDAYKIPVENPWWRTSTGQAAEIKKRFAPVEP